MIQHPHVPHVVCAEPSPGVWQCQCRVCGAAMQGAAPAEGADRFASVHSAHEQAPSHYGFGDLVARATSAVGIKPCAPCKKRQAQLNGLLPRVWRR